MANAGTLRNPPLLRLDPERIETERLVLRCPAPDDAAVLAALANHHEIARNLGLMPHPYTVEDARAFIDRAARIEPPGASFAVTLAAGGGLIGVAGYGRRADNGLMDMGYWIGMPWWGRGYATEAARAVVAHAFGIGGLDALPSGYHADNPASGHILTAKLGFEIVGREMQFSAGQGKAVDTILVRLTRARWQAPGDAA
jgi:RimJ/RimL family protein N-acetyltransferase